MFAGKVVKMDRDEYNQLDRTCRLLEQMHEQLNDLTEEDESLTDLAEDCWKAQACLEDFLTAYNDQFRRDN